MDDEDVTAFADYQDVTAFADDQDATVATVSQDITGYTDEEILGCVSEWVLAPSAWYLICKLMSAVPWG